MWGRGYTESVWVGEMQYVCVLLGLVCSVRRVCCMCACPCVCVYSKCVCLGEGAEVTEGVFGEEGSAEWVWGYNVWGSVWGVEAQPHHHSIICISYPTHQRFCTH